MSSTYVVTCSSCGAANRIAAENEGKIGRCGSCHQKLMPLYFRPQQLTDSSFDAFVVRYGGPLLAEFWAPWCPHCTAFAPTVHKVAGMLAGIAAVVQVNTQDNPALAGRFSVRSIPVLLLMNQGKVIDQLPGVRSSEEIISWFRHHS